MATAHAAAEEKRDQPGDGERIEGADHEETHVAQHIDFHRLSQFLHVVGEAVFEHLGAVGVIVHSKSRVDKWRRKDGYDGDMIGEDEEGAEELDEQAADEVLTEYPAAAGDVL